MTDRRRPRSASPCSSPRTRELELLHGWLDTWRGIGEVVVGMARQDYDLQLTRYDGRGWRATFYTTGMAQDASWAVPSMRPSLGDSHDGSDLDAVGAFSPPRGHHTELTVRSI
jgi:hypothetical protein